MNKRTAVDDPRDKPRVDQLVPRTKPNWGEAKDGEKMKATWMGHASYLVEMPRDAAGARSPVEPGKVSERGVTIVFDPAWSKRCSPVQFAGPLRYQGQSSLCR
jgi:N-acyl-phosphatidylethanolamine-hydrolysing phospholipase D